MKKIYKYKIDPSLREYDLPYGATILSAGVQGDDIFIWALTDTENPLSTRYIDVYGTGHIVSENGTLRFIDTVFIGNFVFHVFENVSSY